MNGCLSLAWHARDSATRRIRESKVMVVTDLAPAPSRPELTVVADCLIFQDHTLVGHERDPDNKLLEAPEHVALCGPSCPRWYSRTQL